MRKYKLKSIAILAGELVLAFLLGMLGIIVVNIHDASSWSEILSAVFIGVLIGVFIGTFLTHKGKKAQGTIFIQQDGDKKTYILDLDGDPEELDQLEMVVFKVDK